MTDIRECVFITAKPHYCKEASRLTCGHYVCRMCRGIAILAIKEFSCKFCQALNSPNNLKVENLGQINDFERMKFIAVKYEEALRTFKDKEDFLQNCLDYTLDEVDVKVDSLKLELDNLRDEIIGKIVDKKNKYLKEFSEKHIENDKDLKKLHEILKEKSNAATDTFGYYESKIQEMDEFKSRLDFETSFDVNIDKLSTNIIGKFKTVCELEKDFKDNDTKFIELFDGTKIEVPGMNQVRKHSNITLERLQLEKVKSQIETKTFHKFEISKYPSVQFALPDNRLLVFSGVDQYLEVYDSSLKFIRKVTTMYDHVYRFQFVTSNGVDKLYFCDSSKYGASIVMTDFNFMFMKNYTVKDDNFIPGDLAFYNGALYVGNKKNENLFKFTESLEYISTVEIKKTSVMNIKILNNIACILGYDSTISFYNIAANSFDLLYRYKNFYGLQVDGLNIFDDYFTFTSKGKQSQNVNCQEFYFFRNNGETFELIAVQRPTDYLRFKTFCKFNGHILTSNEQFDFFEDDF